MLQSLTFFRQPALVHLCRIEHFQDHFQGGVHMLKESHQLPQWQCTFIEDWSMVPTAVGKVSSIKQKTNNNVQKAMPMPCI